MPLNFEKDVQRILEREGIDAIIRHANVSIRHNCKCGTCFCCYCASYLKSDEGKIKLYENGNYIFKAPPVCTAKWTPDSWIKFIDSYNGFLYQKGGKMIRKDDRTPEQKKTHQMLVVGTDSFMSGWGEAKNGLSYAAWACTPEQLHRVHNWVSNRGEMKRVRVIDEKYNKYYPNPNLCAHLHIYFVDDNHPSLK